MEHHYGDMLKTLVLDEGVEVGEVESGLDGRPFLRVKKDGESSFVPLVAPGGGDYTPGEVEEMIDDAFQAPPLPAQPPEPAEADEASHTDAGADSEPTVAAPLPDEE